MVKKTRTYWGKACLVSAHFVEKKGSIKKVQFDG